jgi:hypothetical protein
LRLLKVILAFLHGLFSHPPPPFAPGKPNLNFNEAVERKSSINLIIEIECRIFVLKLAINGIRTRNGRRMTNCMMYFCICLHKSRTKKQLTAVSEVLLSERGSFVAAHTLIANI